MRDPRITNALALWDEGKGYSEIAREIGEQPMTIGRWINRYLFTHCTTCKTELRRANSGGRCGLCVGEAAEKAGIPA